SHHPDREDERAEVSACALQEFSLQHQSISRPAMLGCYPQTCGADLPWVRAADIVTFGALIAFRAVNLAALLHFGYLPGPNGHRSFFLDASSQNLAARSALLCCLGFRSGPAHRALLNTRVHVRMLSRSTSMSVSIASSGARDSCTQRGP